MSVMSADARLKWTCLICRLGRDKARLFTGTTDRQTSVDIRNTSKQRYLVRRDQGLDRLARKQRMLSRKAVEALISWKGSANICKNVFAAASVASS